MKTIISKITLALSAATLGGALYLSDFAGDDPSLASETQLAAVAPTPMTTLNRQDKPCIQKRSP